LRPVAWKSEAPNKWVKNFKNIEFRTSSLGGLIGESWETLRLEVNNNSEKILILESATLILKDQKLEGQVIEKDVIGAKKQTAEPGEHVYFNVNWEFEKPLYEIYKENISIDIRMKHGDELIEFNIPFEKVA